MQEAQRHVALLEQLLTVGFNSKSKVLRLGFCNARSGPVDISSPLDIVIDNCDNLRILEMTFTTDTLVPSGQVYLPS